MCCLTLIIRALVYRDVLWSDFLTLQISTIGTVRLSGRHFAERIKMSLYCWSAYVHVWQMELNRPLRIGGCSYMVWSRPVLIVSVSCAISFICLMLAKPPVPSTSILQVAVTRTFPSLCTELIFCRFVTNHWLFLFFGVMSSAKTKQLCNAVTWL